MQLAAVSNRETPDFSTYEKSSAARSYPPSSKGSGRIIDAAELSLVSRNVVALNGM